MKVYVVEEHYTSGTGEGIEGVFLSREKALECIEELREEDDSGEGGGPYSVYEYDLDNPDYGRRDVTDAARAQG